MSGNKPLCVVRDDHKHEHVPTDHVQHMEHYFHAQIATQIENPVDNNKSELQQQRHQETDGDLIALHIFGDTGRFGILKSIDSENLD